MTRRKRRNQSSAFKAKVALAALKGERTLAELAEQFDAGKGAARGKGAGAVISAKWLESLWWLVSS